MSKYLAKDNTISFRCIMLCADYEALFILASGKSKSANAHPESKEAMRPLQKGKDERGKPCLRVAATSSTLP